MATTNFVDGVTLSAASWFNDIDALAYEGTFPSGPSALVVTGATTLAVFNTVATTINAFGAATTVNIGAGAASTLNANFTTAINLNTSAVVSNQTTLAVFNTASTTINAFGAASVALNIGHASAAAAFPGGISIPTGKTLAGAGSINISGDISGSNITGVMIRAQATTANGAVALRTNARATTEDAQIKFLASDNTTVHSLLNSTVNRLDWYRADNTLMIGFDTTGLILSYISSTAVSAGANDSGGAGYKVLRVPN